MVHEQEHEKRLHLHLLAHKPNKLLVADAATTYGSDGTAMFKQGLHTKTHKAKVTQLHAWPWGAWKREKGGACRLSASPLNAPESCPDAGKLAAYVLLG